MKYLSVCSGMEAASVAWHPLGWEPVGFSEIEPFPAAILKHRFPNTPNHGDLTQHHTWPIEPGTIDLLVGGTPCQSFSVAGLRKGMQDPRGNLALTFLGLADRLRPRWIVWENVPGVLSSNGGRDFGAFLGALGQLGYGWAYRVLDAQHFGVPQRRRRVFVVATSSGDGRLAGEVLSLPEGLRGYLEARQQKRKGPAADAGAGVEADGRSAGTINCQPDGISGTVTSKWHKGSGGPAGDEHYNMIAESKSHWEGGDIHPTLNQSHNIGSPGYSNQELFSQKGGGLVPIPYRKAKRAQSDKDDESWVEGEVSNTLNNFDLGDTRTTHAVVEPVAIQGTIIGRGENAGPQGTGATEGGPMFTLTKTDIHGVAHSIPIQDGREIDKKQNGMGIGQPGDPSYTIDTTGAQSVAHCSDVSPTVTSSVPPYSRTGNERVEAEAVVAFQPGNLRRQAGADPSTEATTTLKATLGDQMPHVCYPLKDPNDIACDADRRQNGVGENGDPAFTLRTAVTPGVATSMAVRRLTPVECERLQGFPDNWSRIPWKGKPEEECPDGPRYKACGNSMAVPVMRWIGRQIAEVEARQAANKTS